MSTQQDPARTLIVLLFKTLTMVLLHWCRQVYPVQTFLKIFKTENRKKRNLLPTAMGRHNGHVCHTRPHIIQNTQNKTRLVPKDNDNNWKGKHQTSYRTPRHHSQTRRLTGFEVTSIQINIFTFVSSLILYYCNNHLLNLEESKCEEAKETNITFSLNTSGLTRAKDKYSLFQFHFVKETIGLNFIFYFLLYNCQITPTHGITPIATEWHTKRPEIQSFRNK